jgi:PLP dependent protein
MISRNLASVKQRIERAAIRVRRNPADITLIAVTKTALPDQIRQAVSAGIGHIGENRVQQVVLKYNSLGHASKKIKWHMIGHLQTNKARQCIQICDTVHSLDSLRLASEINKQAQIIKKRIDCFVQVNIANEYSKYGIDPECVFDFVKQLKPMAFINIVGLMAMAPFSDKPELSRPYFRRLCRIKNDLASQQGLNIRELSMGMSQDFEVAVEEGATFLRVGSAIFNQ